MGMRFEATSNSLAAMFVAATSVFFLLTGQVLAESSSMAGKGDTSMSSPAKVMKDKKGTMKDTKGMMKDTKGTMKDKKGTMKDDKMMPSAK